MELQKVTQQSSTVAEVASTRAAQEVQAAIVVAKSRPRDENNAISRMLESCKRKTLAEKAVYAYPRGGQTVSGPSIRLAETMARAWGNIDFGIVELESKSNSNGFGESVMLAYCWDLETNTRVTKTFTVKHKRDTRQGSVALKDERDIYENNANNGARRLRACILSVIPGDIVEACVEACQKTMSGGSEPIIDRARKMVEAFKEQGVSMSMIERRLAHKLDAITEPELVKLREIFVSIRDGFASREDFFEHEPVAAAQVSAPPVVEMPIKNLAPQTAEAAKEQSAAIRKRKVAATPVEASKEDPVSDRFSVNTREELINETRVFAQEHKVHAQVFIDKASSLFNKQLAELSLDELKLVARMIQSEVVK